MSPVNLTDLNTSNLPTHVAIIMDGNGRWAKKHRINRIQGHEKGSEAVREVVQTCREIGIRHLTLYAFSTENWQRPKKEVDALMVLLKRFLKSERKEMHEKNIRMSVIGQIERLPQDVRAELQKVMTLTKKNSALHLHLALSYGARAEIVRMAQVVSQKCKSGQIDPEAIDEQCVAEHLYTHGIPDPDLLIRTSGEMRISNFLLWQIAYTELYVTPTLWPDFGKDEFVHILKDYQSRDRRFGRV
ncbi:MAG: isoprenyl transferase [Desulfobacterales bacterium]|nr:MAG: isoprenyl transferase [Desulfobacterales bacterium]